MKPFTAVCFDNGRGKERECVCERERARVLGEILSFESKDHGVANDQEAHGAVNGRVPRTCTRNALIRTNYSSLVMKPLHLLHEVYTREARVRLAAARN